MKLIAFLDGVLTVLTLMIVVWFFALILVGFGALTWKILF